MPLTAPIFNQVSGTPSAPASPGTFGAMAPNYQNPPSGTSVSPQVNQNVFGTRKVGTTPGTGVQGIKEAQSLNTALYTPRERAEYQTATELIGAAQHEYAKRYTSDYNLNLQNLEAFDAQIPGLLNRAADGARININSLRDNYNGLSNDFNVARDRNVNANNMAADATYDAYKKGLQFQNAGFGQRTTETNKRLREGSNILNFTLDKVNAGQTLNHKFQANEADRRRSDQFNVEQGYGERETTLNDLLGLRGREAASDINRQFNRNQADSRQSLVDRGLYNTTVMDSVGRGIEEDRSRELRGLDEQVTEQELAQLERLSGDTLAAQERGIGLKNQLTQQIAGQRDRGIERAAGLGVTQAADRTDAAKFGAQVDKDRLDAEREYTNLITGQDNIRRNEATGIRTTADLLNLASGERGIGMLNNNANTQQAMDTALAKDLTGRRLDYMTNNPLMRPGAQEFNTLLQSIPQMGAVVPQVVQPPSYGPLL